MPIYEFRCEDCGAGFETLVLSAADAGKAACPECGGVRLEKLFSVFSPSMPSAATPRCETTGSCRTPNLPGCRSGACGL
ncbi:MAG: FmdB family zinc ribbon protein [Candidatus Nitrospinota bacterium M3_3B_026]